MIISPDVTGIKAEQPQVCDVQTTWEPTQAVGIRPSYTVLVGLDHFSYIIEMIVQIRFWKTRHLRFIYFSRSSELIRLADWHSFDFAFMYLGNIVWDERADDGSYLGAAGILSKLKTRYNKPIIVTQGLNLTEEYASTGVAFLTAPFLPADMCRHVPELEHQTECEQTSGRKTFSVTVIGHMAGLEHYFLSMPLQEMLGDAYAVVLHCYSRLSDWAQYDNKSDLLVLYLNPTLKGTGDCEITPKEAIIQIREKCSSPIVFLTNESKYKLDQAAELISAGAAGMFSFTPPFPTVNFVEALRLGLVQIAKTSGSA